MDVFGMTDVGKSRKRNEDQFIVADLSKSLLVHQTSLSVDQYTRLFGRAQGALLVVADGMGGQPAGDRASALAVETIARYVVNTMPWLFGLQEDHEGNLKDELKSALERCQQRIETEVAKNPKREGMGTTLTIAYVVWPRLYVVHAGDSRCYLWHEGELQQITTDQTIAQEMVDQGGLTAEEVEGSRWNHVLSSCIGGGESKLSPKAYRADLRAGDVLLLCTDGLTKHVSDQEIAAILRRQQLAQDTCRQLIEKANAAGGTDNITAIVARTDTDEGGQEAEATQKVSLDKVIAKTEPETATGAAPPLVEEVVEKAND